MLRVPGQFTTRLKVRSIVGLLPLCAVSVYRPEVIAKLPGFVERVQWFNENRPELLANISQPGRPGAGGRFMLSLLHDEKLRRVLARMLDPDGVPRATTASARCRASTSTTPTCSTSGGQEYRVGYLPAESDSGMFGGNSNWRGPDLGADQRAHRPRAVADVRVTTATTSRSSARPDRAST